MKKRYDIPFLFFIAVVAGANIFLTSDRWQYFYPKCAFLITLIALVAALGVIGLQISGRIDGVLIDNRNRVSLSKFQATVWTVLVIGALVTVASHNIAIDDASPLSLTIPPELLAAMGISATSFVATPLVLSLKADSEPTPEDVDKVTQSLGMDAGTLKNDGKVFGRSSPADASWADMLRGEEVGNAASPDLSKIQQLFISLLLYGIYGAAILGTLDQDPKIAGLPPLGEKFVWLMAISHASYLAYKAAPHTADSDPALAHPPLG